MRQIFIILLAILLIIPGAIAEIDLSGMTYEELVELRDMLNRAIWNCDEWQEVVVPIGVWEIGKDIPAGHWTIAAYPGAWTICTYCEMLDETGRSQSLAGGVSTDVLCSETYRYYDRAKDQTETDIDAKEGWFMVITAGSAVFSPYAGKPDLGFRQ